MIIHLQSFKLSRFFDYYFSGLFYDQQSIQLSINANQTSLIFLHHIPSCIFEELILFNSYVKLIFCLCLKIEMVYMHTKNFLNLRIFKVNLMIFGSSFCDQLNVVISVDYQQFFHRVMKKEIEEWIAWGKQKKRFLTFYKESVLDLTDFIAVHPGGRKSMDNFIYKDITELLFTVYPHRKEITLATLNKYCIGINTTHDLKNKNEKENKSLAENSKSKKKVCFKKTLNYSVEKKQGESKFKTHNQHGFDRNEFHNIKKSFNQGKKQKNPIKDKFYVSIQLISDSYIEQALPISQKQSHNKNNKANNEQLDVNILIQEIEQSKTLAKMPILEVKHINR